MKTIDYSKISSVEELYDIIKENANINKERIISEKKDGDDPEKVQKTDKIEVVYSDLKQKPTNIFKHIIVFTNDKDPKGNKTLKNIYEAVDELKKSKSEIIPEIHVFEFA